MQIVLEMEEDNDEEEKKSKIKKTIKKKINFKVTNAFDDLKIVVKNKTYSRIISDFIAMF